jgi:hypothetical protein
MKRLIIKSKNSLWPTVVWKDSQLLVYYLGENEDEVKVKETREIDFDELFLHLDNGGSVFVTTKPRICSHECDSDSLSEASSELLQDFI